MVRLALALSFVIDLYLDDRGMICAFEINQSNAKTILILNTARLALLTFLPVYRKNGEF